MSEYKEKVYLALKNCKQNYSKQIEIMKCKNLLNSIYYYKERLNDTDFSRDVEEMVKKLEDLYLEITAGDMITFSELDLIDLYLEEKSNEEIRLELELNNEEE